MWPAALALATTCRSMNANTLLSKGTEIRTIPRCEDAGAWIGLDLVLQFRTMRSVASRTAPNFALAYIEIVLYTHASI